MGEGTTIESLMTRKVVTITPETPLVKAVDILLQHNFNGLPVVDKEGKLVGILTEYDLTIKGSAIHLPTFIKLLGSFKVYKKDRGLIQEDVKKMLATKVADVMNADPLTLGPEDSLEKAAKTFGEHHRVNPIPIVAVDNKLVGILSRYDMIKLMGAPSVDLADTSNQRNLDRNINRFLQDFEKKFILVSGIRAHYWLVASILFALVGFFIAFAIILRIG